MTGTGITADLRKQVKALIDLNNRVADIYLKRADWLKKNMKILDAPTKETVGVLLEAIRSMQEQDSKLIGGKK